MIFDLSDENLLMVGTFEVCWGKVQPTSGMRRACEVSIGG